jgi:hypothetical protein
MISDSELRYELKVRCESHRVAEARSWLGLSPAGFWVEYPPREVNSIYFDTPDLNDLGANLMGVSLRQKVRLRWYGEMAAKQILPTLELKYKQNMLGGKKRFALTLPIDLNSRWTEIVRSVKQQSPEELQATLASRTQPTIITRYRREYYVSVDGGVRATLDYAQEGFGQRFHVRPNLRNRLFIADFVVIELKAGQDEEERLHQLMAHIPIARSRSSKYVTGAAAEI